MSTSASSGEKLEPRPHDDAFKVAFGKRFEDGQQVMDDPKSWPIAYKIRVMLLLSLLAFVASLGSSITAPAQDALAAEFNASSQVLVFTTSLYILGFVFGPIIWAPLSEISGRRWSLLPATFCLGIFAIGYATSQTLAAIFVTRFFAGIFGAAPVSNVTAALGDIFAAKPRGLAMGLYSLCVVGGPLLGPVIGAGLTQKSWRWTGYVEAILALTATLLATLFLPEVYPSVLLKREAARLRKASGDDRYWHPHEDLRLDAKSIVTKQLARPLLMLTTEPMVTAIALYASFVYALVYMALQLVSLVFRQNYRYGPVVANLPFIAIFLGIVVCGLPITLVNQPIYFRAVDRNGGKAVPEARLPPVAIGGVLLTCGLFIFAWTARESIPWPVPCIGLALVGAGFNTVFQNCLNYLVDSYGLFAASASSANTILRSILAACLPFAVAPMFEQLGSGVAISILGALTGVFMPMPWLLMRFSAGLRARSRFAQDLA